MKFFVAQAAICNIIILELFGTHPRNDVGRNEINWLGLVYYNRNVQFNQKLKQKVHKK